MLEVLIEFGGPAAIVEREVEARELMRKVGGKFFTQEKLDARSRRLTRASASRRSTKS